jgi:glucose-1-phosphate thymidylyltransferase
VQLYSNFIISYLNIKGTFYYLCSVLEGCSRYLEITDLNQLYLEQNQLHVEVFGRGFAWFDTGTQDSLLEAAQFMQTVEHLQDFKIACLEEIAVRQKWMEYENLQKLTDQHFNSSYSRYLEEISQKFKSD